jgi:hypothetical protein
MWRGRAQAVLNAIDGISLGLRGQAALSHLDDYLVGDVAPITALLHEARYKLVLESASGASVAVTANAPFDYFDELRKMIETAQVDVLFSDPHMDADFVARYLPMIKPTVKVRLLGRNYITKLVPAVEMHVQQHGGTVEVRTAPNFHDRHLILDGRTGYQSGASFKDGGKHAPTTLTQVVDLFDAVKSSCEAAWAAGKVYR